MLERESLDFRFVCDPVFNLSAQEEDILERLREVGLSFGILPRYDPTSFLCIMATIECATQKVEIGVDRDNQYYYSFITRRTPFADKLKGYLDQVFGPENFDQRGHVASRSYVWYSYRLNPVLPRNFYHKPPARRPGRKGRVRSSLFNFDSREQHFLRVLEQVVKGLNEGRESPMQFHIYPRETPYGGIELMVGDGRASQPAKIFVKGLYPITYHMITENTPLGERMREYLDAALGAANLDSGASRTRGKFLSLVYNVRHPRSVLQQFEGLD